MAKPKEQLETDQKLQQLQQGIGQDLNNLANRIEKIDALVDRHSTRLRGIEANLMQINNAIGQLLEKEKDNAKV